MRAIRRYSALTAVFFGFFALTQCVAGEVENGRVIDASSALAAQPGAPSRIPADAKRGVLEAVIETTLVIDGVQVRMAPAGLIRGPTNLIVLPATVSPGTNIFYRINADGQVINAWLPTEEEMRQRKTTNWTFSLGSEKF